MPVSKEARLVRRFARMFGAGTDEAVGLGALPPDDVSPTVLDTTRRLERGDPVSPGELAELDAVIHVDGYPALDVKGNMPSQAFPQRWRFMNDVAYTTKLRSALTSVGRVEARDAGGRRYLGTAWVVGDGVLLTNRHVARSFASGLGRRNVAFLGERGPRVDWKREREPDPEVEAGGDTDPMRITGVRLIHPYWDVAVLTFEPKGRIFFPLELCAVAPTTLRGAAVAVLGYPELDPDLTAAVRADVFGNRFGVKRVSPGMVLDLGDTPRGDDEGAPVVEGALFHDASTLGGSSGSAVLYLPRGSDANEPPPGFGGVIALHFAGDPDNERNLAIPTWQLLSDPRLVDALGNPTISQPKPPLPAWVSSWDPLEPPDAEAPATLAPVTAPPTSSGGTAPCDESAPPPEPNLPAAAARQPAGSAWVARYPASSTVETLEPEFRGRVTRFRDALTKAGVRVTVLASWRPPERAWLMHWAWLIAKKQVAPASVPVHPSLPIQWDLGSLEPSIAASQAMVDGFGARGDTALRSRHTEGRAIDLDIRWQTPALVDAADGAVVTLNQGDQDALTRVGRSYGLVRGATASTHWSDDGS